MSGAWGWVAGVGMHREAGILLCFVGPGEQFRLHLKCPATQPNAGFKKIAWTAMWLWSERAGQEWEQEDQL